ncbi:MAG: hypothetical protein KC620_21745 [Myxococcales bacterium]|nr:hypothetical protein [Myxococcales bacterium]
MRAAEKLNTLSQDLCIGGWLTEAQRKRLVQRAEAGAIREAAVDAYVDEVRDRIDQAGPRLSNESFCRSQRNAWRRHFGQ